MLFGMFYLSVVPIGLHDARTRQRILRSRREPDAASYWIERTPPGPEPITMKNQF